MIGQPQISSKTNLLDSDEPRHGARLFADLAPRRVGWQLLLLTNQRENPPGVGSSPTGGT